MTKLNFMTIFTIFGILIKSETSESARILGIFPVNGRSHATVGQELMKVLAKKGHQVDVINHYPLKEPVFNYKDLSLRGSLEDSTNNVNYSTIQSFSATSFKILMEITADPVCGLFKHPVINNIIKNPPNDPPYDLVIVEIFTAHCYFAFGRHLKVPMIGLTASVILDWEHESLGNPHNLAFSPGGFSDFPSKMNFWQRLQNVLLYNTIKYQFNYYVNQQKKYVDEYFGPGYPSIYELSTEFALVFTNSHYTLNGIKPFTPSVIEIGGVHIQDNEEKLLPEIQKWLDESKHGCVYMSFGSMVKIETFPKETLDAFYGAFRNIAPIRVLIKIANKEKLPPGLPENVKTYHWFPQIQILKHKNVKAFVTHGGLLGTLESIYYAVPMVGFPLFGDQPNNLKNYENNKIAVTLDYHTVTEQKFTEALNTVIKNGEYRNNIKRISKLYYDRPITPQDTAVFWTEYVLRHGNILRSPAVDLKWWQVELLDVYGFILFIVLFTIYIAFLVVRKLIKCVYSMKKTEKGKLISKKRK